MLVKRLNDCHVGSITRVGLIYVLANPSPLTAKEWLKVGSGGPGNVDPGKQISLPTASQVILRYQLLPQPSLKGPFCPLGLSHQYLLPHLLVPVTRSAFFVCPEVRLEATVAGKAEFS